MGIIGNWLASDEGPSRTSGQLRVGSMASGMEVTLPYVALRGARPGRTLWLHGQVHGDEINGMVAALRFARSLRPETMSGNLVVTPTGNPQALDARRKRNPYDELDLDQSYPGSASGLITERLAHALFEEVRGVADVLINLHTMNPLFDARPYAVYKVHAESSVSEAEVLAAMAPFYPHVACRQDVGGKGELPGNIAGALDYQCLATGICAFMLELGSGSRLEAETVALAERGFSTLAQQMGILAGPPQPAATSLRRVTRRGWITADEGGLFIPTTRAGECVSEGKSIGDLLRLDGQQTAVHPVTRDGVLIGLRSDPVVHTGERLAFVAWEWDTVNVA
ncbi:M14 family metallopeptidase [Cupriavidus sp. CV2]|uniref:M14 family metallopeptidase n=1 Tax=Cupriavidus ulmosensis TaxID=3065913 RepID=UPI00296AD1D1|nr:M14 family metallopeptidase [Cupriavidus sp. CV2]MDW3687856.1 M14 family metallopeptidase [Cupriavidus sp. CV2]